MYKQIVTIEDDWSHSFEKRVNEYLSEGWQVLSTNCNSTEIEGRNGDFYKFYQAVLGLPIKIKKVEH